MSKIVYILLVLVTLSWAQPSDPVPSDTTPTDLSPTLPPSTTGPTGLSPIFTGNGTINFKNKSDLIAISVVSSIVVLIIIIITGVCCCGHCGGCCSKYKHRSKNKCARCACCRRQNQISFQDGKIETIDLELSD